MYHLTGKEDAMAELESFEAQTKTKMYWVVDAFTKLSDDFDFSYYPTQWDISKIHVFTDEDGVYRNVRLYPKGTFKPGHSYFKSFVNGGLLLIGGEGAPIPPIVPASLMSETSGIFFSLGEEFLT